MCLCFSVYSFLYIYSIRFVSFTFSASFSFQTANIVHLIFVIVFIFHPPTIPFRSLYSLRRIHFKSFHLDAAVFFFSLVLNDFVSFYAILSLPHILYQLLWYHFKHSQSLKQKFEPKWFATFRFQFILIIAFIHRYDLEYLSLCVYEFHLKIVSHQKIHFEPPSCTQLLLLLLFINIIYLWGILYNLHKERLMNWKRERKKKKWIRSEWIQRTLAKKKTDRNHQQTINKEKKERAAAANK